MLLPRQMPQCLVCNLFGHRCSLRKVIRHVVASRAARRRGKPVAAEPWHRTAFEGTRMTTMKVSGTSAGNHRYGCSGTARKPWARLARTPHGGLSCSTRRKSLDTNETI
jgi:hypothetical protein